MFTAPFLYIGTINKKVKYFPGRGKIPFCKFVVKHLGVSALSSNMKLQKPSA
jgi:hypothetical protein